MAYEQGLHFCMAIIHAEQDKAFVLEKLRKGKIKPLGPVPELTERDVEQAERIVVIMDARATPPSTPPFPCAWGSRQG